MTIYHRLCLDLMLVGEARRFRPEMVRMSRLFIKIQQIRESDSYANSRKINLYGAITIDS